MGTPTAGRACAPATRRRPPDAGTVGPRRRAEYAAVAESAIARRQWHLVRGSLGGMPRGRRRPPAHACQTRRRGRPVPAASVAPAGPGNRAPPPRAGGRARTLPRVRAGDAPAVAVARWIGDDCQAGLGLRRVGDHGAPPLVGPGYGRGGAVRTAACGRAPSSGNATGAHAQTAPPPKASASTGCVTGAAGIEALVDAAQELALRRGHAEFAPLDEDRSNATPACSWPARPWRWSGPEADATKEGAWTDKDRPTWAESVTEATPVPPDIAPDQDFAAKCPDAPPDLGRWEGANPPCGASRPGRIRTNGCGNRGRLAVQSPNRLRSQANQRHARE